jgi:hypothetical protein
MTQHPIAAFVLARLDELEHKARATAYSFASSIEDPWSVRQKDRRDEMSWAVYSQGKYLKASELHEADARHIAAHDPAYVLADIAAKRRIVATFVEVDAHPNRLVYAFMQQQWVALRAVVAGLALPFARHPDYQESWKP